MFKLRIYDSSFSHCTALGCGDLKIYPKEFTWIRSGEGDGDIAVITQTHFDRVDQVKEKIKIGLIGEPPAIMPHSYEWIIHPENLAKFDYVFTHRKDLAEDHESGKFVCYSFGGCWIYEQDRKIYPKSKNISIIASNKTHTEGHRLRHEIIKGFGEKYNIDVFGRGINNIEYKLTALKDYRYTIVVENDCYDSFFSEKLIDAFVTGTVPIYWGCPGIGDIFDDEGLIHFLDLDMLEKILQDDATEDFYTRNQREISQNFETAKKYVLPDNIIFDWIKSNVIS